MRGFPGGSAGKESACNVGDLGLTHGLGRSLGEGNGYRLQYSGLENSMGCIVHGVMKSRTGLRNFHFYFQCLFTLVFCDLFSLLMYPKYTSHIVPGIEKARSDIFQ